MFHFRLLLKWEMNYLYRKFCITLTRLWGAPCSLWGERRLARSAAPPLSPPWKLLGCRRPGRGEGAAVRRPCGVQPQSCRHWGLYEPSQWSTVLGLESLSKVFWGGSVNSKLQVNPADEPPYGAHALILGSLQSTQALYLLLYSLWVWDVPYGKRFFRLISIEWVYICGVQFPVRDPFSFPNR